MSLMALHVLLVDDDPELRDILRVFFKQHGVELSVLHDGEGLERRLQLERPSIVVMDVMMPKVDGLTALQRLRATGDTIPVVMLTARADEVERILGLEMGADDFVAKPFSPRELLSRIKAIMRRNGTIPSAAPEHREPYCFGDFSLDFVTRSLRQGDKTVPITSGEFALLKIFVTHPMQLLARTRLAHLLHGRDTNSTERGLDVSIWRLRRLLEDSPGSPRYIQTIRGTGYIFVPDRQIETPTL
jgi:two-component system, OmpR family, phosphate regulon response regulator OmpR